ncbi:putative holin [Chromobacterium sp. CV08]|uniref:putative holin n=1 Tax=Chromobacterium sp. CV08 TaxID=3133274 RepID=UPI003DA93866
MAEPVSSTATSATLATVAGLALAPGIDAAIVLGAFAGAAVFVLSSDSLSLGKKAGFFLVSFFAGCLAAVSVAGVLTRWLIVEISPGVCAMLAAAIAVKLLQWLIRKADDPAAALRDLKGGGK